MFNAIVVIVFEPTDFIFKAFTLYQRSLNPIKKSLEKKKNFVLVPEVCSFSWLEIKYDKATKIVLKYFN